MPGSGRGSSKSRTPQKPWQSGHRPHSLSAMRQMLNCYDNAVVETFFKTIKSELIWPVAWQTRSQAEASPKTTPRR